MEHHESQLILEEAKFLITLERLTRQLLEHHGDFSESVIIGLQPRGKLMADAVSSRLKLQLGNQHIACGTMDATFHRDDFRRGEVLLPSAQEMDVDLENKKVILIDDVLYTGRTIRAGLDAMLDFGRPQSVELLVLVDRRYSRELPIEPNYVGITVDTRVSEKVKVEWTANNTARVWLQKINHTSPTLQQ